MNRIDEKIEEKRKHNKLIKIIYITCGFPDLITTERIAKTLIESGVDMIELGVPFSDPIADGPVLQYCSSEALKKNISMDDVLKIGEKIRKYSDIPLLIMSYLNPVYIYGIEKLLSNCVKKGIDGLIIPDMPLEEILKYKDIFKKNNLHFINFISPVTDKERIKKIIENSCGFIYVISVTGVTGARKNLSSEVTDFLRDIRELTEKPVMIGFGISKPEHVKMVSKYIDGFIIGSALMNIIKYNVDKNSKNLYNNVRNFINLF